MAVAVAVEGLAADDVDDFVNHTARSPPSELQPDDLGYLYLQRMQGSVAVADDLYHLPGHDCEELGASLLVIALVQRCCIVLLLWTVVPLRRLWWFIGDIKMAHQTSIRSHSPSTLISHAHLTHKSLTSHSQVTHISLTSHSHLTQVYVST